MHSIRPPSRHALALNADPHTLSEAMAIEGLEEDLRWAQQFLAEYEDSPHTRRRYETEIQRLFLWAVRVRRQRVSALTREAVREYEAFLRAPPALWCGPRRARGAPDWKPFAAPRTDRGGNRLPRRETSVQAGLAALQSLFAWWVDAQYLRHNPWQLQRLKHRAAAPGAETETDGFDRFLDAPMRAAIDTVLEAWPRATRRGQAEAWRLRWLYTLLGHTGCRIGELASATQQDLRWHEGVWWLHVLGKGRRRRQVPVPCTVIDTLGEVRRFHGLSPRVSGEEPPLPLLTPLWWFAGRDHRGAVRSGISPRQVWTLLDRLFGAAADHLDAQAATHDPVADEPPEAIAQRAARLRAASAHWCRHTYVSRAVDAGVADKTIMDSTGHRSHAMLLRYQHTTRREQHRALGAVFAADTPSETE